MAKESKEDRANRKSTSIGVEKELARKINTICIHEGKTHSELISPVIREFVELEYARVVRLMQQEVGQRKSDRGSQRG